MAQGVGRERGNRFMLRDDLLQRLVLQINPPDTGEVAVVIEVQHRPGWTPDRVHQAPALVI
ncbi:hypothetical protein D3C85_1609740 [compost metagenome]